MSSIPLEKSLVVGVRATALTESHAVRRDLQADASPAFFVLGASSCILGLCVLVFAVDTIHWPLAGDAALMHYIGFLMSHGSVPYRDIADINLPGSYLIDYAVMHTLGSGSLAWRGFDLILMGCSILAMISIARPHGWFAGVFAGSLLTLVHGCDGIYEPGQRDLVVAVLLLGAYAALFRATRKDSPQWMLAFGLCAGLTATIKPTFLPFGPLLLLTLILAQRHERRPVLMFLAWGFTGVILPVLGVLTFLWRMHATSAFLWAIRGVMLYHASVGRKPLSFLLLHSFAPLMPLLLLWICCLFSQGKHWENWEGSALLIGAALGLASYVVQGKGYAYQRYPFIALLLLLMSIDFTRAVSSRPWARTAAWTGIAFGTLFLAPVSVLKANRYNWRDTEFSSMLQRDLLQAGGRSLSGKVQCIDTIGGCFEVLYRMRLEQSDGFFYDEFLFGPNSNAVVAESRKKLWHAMQANPPDRFIVTDDLFPSGPGEFRKLGQWPQFAAYLHQEYWLCAQGTPPDMVRWWSRTERPHSYRIYCRNTDGQIAGPLRV